MESDASSLHSGREVFGEDMKDKESRRGRKVRKRIRAAQLLLVYIILIVLMLAGMGLGFIVIWGIDKTEWFHSRCNHICETKQLKGGTPPLLIISLSGFSRDYLDRVEMTTLNRMKKCGATAERVIPSFPLKTYPNHATIVTGFYPGRHGIGADKKPEWSSSEPLEPFKTNVSEEYFEEEPIWSLLSKVKRDKTASLFWPGPFAKKSEYIHPAYHVKFDPTITDSDQFDQIIRWLKLPSKDRPGLIMVHLDYLKHVGFHHKNEEQVYQSVQRLDRLLGRLFTKLHREKLLHCLNVAIVSDGGITHTTSKVVLLKQKGSKWLIDPGATTMLYLEPDSKGMINADAVVKEFQCRDDQNEQLFVHTRRTQPHRWYYRDSRMSGEVLLVGRDGSHVVEFEDDDDDDEIVGNYGGDFTDPSTHTIFFAMGPSVKKGVMLPAIQNVEFMNFWAALLEVDCVENDGDQYIMETILKKHPSDSPKIEDVPLCDYRTTTTDIKVCGQCEKAHDIHLKNWLAGCRSSSPLVKPIMNTAKELCYMPICNEGILKSSAGHQTSIIEVYDLWSGGGLGSIKCPYITLRFDEVCPALHNSNTVQAVPLSAFHDKGIANHRASHVLLKKGFIETYFKPLNAYTKLVAGKLRKIISITGVYGERGEDLPEYIYRILIACPHGWAQNGLHCNEHNKTEILSFLFPHLDEDMNSLDRATLLLHYSARLKDIELLIGYRFHLLYIPEAEMRRLRLHIPYKLW